PDARHGWTLSSHMAVYAAIHVAIHVASDENTQSSQTILTWVRGDAYYARPSSITQATDGSCLPMLSAAGHGAEPKIRYVPRCAQGRTLQARHQLCVKNSNSESSEGGFDYPGEVNPGSLLTPVFQGPLSGMPKSTLSIFFASVLICVSPVSCAFGSPETSKDILAKTQNPVSYFEIPVTDMDRAIAFYEAVFKQSLTRTVIDGNEMALFPYDEQGQGATGALAKGVSYTPSISGPRIYFSVISIEETLNLAVAAGGRVAYPKTSIGDFWVAEFDDSEGNRIALSSPID
ncbi:MAG: VOC family protein, partial [Pseudomonadota bacterium]